MAQTTISALTAASGIDGSQDYIPIDRASVAATQKINRNTFLGITGSPVGNSDTQSITNKTFDNTNTVSLKDTLFTLQDDGDTTKQAKFQLSGITTATTRTYTMPNASTTLVGTDNTATLTNKTLTNPTISGGTMDNTTITVDSISGHTSSTVVTVGGVQMNNGTIGTASAVTSNSIAASAVVPNKLLTGTGTGWSWQDWTPTLTNLTLGNGTVTAKYIQTGKTITYRFEFVLGSTSAVGSSPRFTLPATMASAAYGDSYPLGVGAARDTGSAAYEAVAVFVTTSQAEIRTYSASGSYSQQATITNLVPFTYGTGDSLFVTGTYEAA